MLTSSLVSVINGSTDRVVDNITLSGYTSQYPIAVSINSRTNMLYVASVYSDIVYVINGSTNRIVANIHVYGLDSAEPDIAVNSATNDI